MGHGIGDQEAGHEQGKLQRNPRIASSPDLTIGIVVHLAHKSLSYDRPL